MLQFSLALTKQLIRCSFQILTVFLTFSNAPEKLPVNTFLKKALTSSPVFLQLSIKEHSVLKAVWPLFDTSVSASDVSALKLPLINSHSLFNAPLSVVLAIASSEPSFKIAASNTLKSPTQDIVTTLSFKLSSIICIAFTLATRSPSTKSTLM